MKVAVVGSRTYTDYAKVCRDLDRARAKWGDFTVVSGGCKGPDCMAIAWATERGLPFVIHPAQWAEYGRKAGPMRNKLIVDDCDRLIAFWDGESRGTAHSIGLARAAGKSVYIRSVPGPTE